MPQGKYWERFWNKSYCKTHYNWLPVMVIWKVKVKVLVMSNSLGPWTVAHLSPLSMEFSRQEYWSELPFPSSGDLPDSGVKSTSPVAPALAGRFLTASITWEALLSCEDRKWTVTKYQTCWHFDLGLPSLQNCDKQICVYKPLSPWQFVIRAWMD